MKNHALLALVTLACGLSGACGGRTAWDGSAGSADGSGKPPPGGDDATTIGGGDPTPFVGPWSCDARNTGISGGAPYSEPTLVIATFAAIPDGTLTMATDTLRGTPGDYADAGACPPIAWSVSGSTAALVAGQTCVDQGPPATTLTFTSGTFVISTTKTAALELTITAPQESGTLVGTCTRLEADAGDGG